MEGVKMEQSGLTFGGESKVYESRAASDTAGVSATAEASDASVIEDGKSQRSEVTVGGLTFGGASKVAESAFANDAAEAEVVSDRSVLLMSSSASLSLEIESLMRELVLSTSSSSEQLLSQELASYTAAARIRDTLLSE